MTKLNIKNLIFDYGGVIMDIHPMAYAEEMIRLGCPDIARLHESFMQQQVYRKFETGIISVDEFRGLVRAGLPNHATDSQIDHAWNLILGEIPLHRIEFLRSLQPKYRIFLLSNTNPVHYEFYQDYARKTFGLPSLDSLFEKAYYSFKIGLYKPDHDIFHFVLKDCALDPAETAFIDDMAENVEAAKACGLQGIHIAGGSDVVEVITRITNPK